MGGQWHNIISSRERFFLHTPESKLFFHKLYGEILATTLLVGRPLDPPDAQVCSCFRDSAALYCDPIVEITAIFAFCFWTPAPWTPTSWILASWTPASRTPASWTSASFGSLIFGSRVFGSLVFGSRVYGSLVFGLKVLYIV